MEKQQARSVAIIGTVCLIVAFSGLFAIVSGLIDSESLFHELFLFIFTIVSLMIVILGPAIGLARFYKKHVDEIEPNVNGDVAIAITVIGAISMITSGLLVGDGFGEFLFVTGIIVCFGALMSVLGLFIYRLA